MVDSVVIQSATENNKEDPKHIEAMIAKVDALETSAETSDAQGGSSAKPEKPEWVPEKFWDAEKGEVRVEALAQSYRELESKKGATKEETVTEDPNPSEEKPQDEAEKALADKGLNISDFREEFAREGKLSDASYEALAKVGITRDVVDAYIAGQQALADRLVSEVHSVTGGEQGFAEMVEWAKTNADPKLVSAYNRALDTGDIDAVKLAAAGLFQEFKKSRPEEPALLSGSGGKVTGDVYESRAQLIADMSDPRYKTDKAFRQKVVEKLSRSDIL